MAFEMGDGGWGAPLDPARDWWWPEYTKSAEPVSVETDENGTTTVPIGTDGKTATYVRTGSGTVSAALSEPLAATEAPADDVLGVEMPEQSPAVFRRRPRDPAADQWVADTIKPAGNIL